MNPREELIEKIVPEFLSPDWWDDQGEQDQAYEDASYITNRFAIGRWVPVSEGLPKHSKPVIGRHPEWKCDDFNPEGIMECFVTQDGKTFLGAVWNDEQDCYETEIVSPAEWLELELPKEEPQSTRLATPGWKEDV